MSPLAEVTGGIRDLRSMRCGWVTDRPQRETDRLQPEVQIRGGPFSVQTSPRSQHLNIVRRDPEYLEVIGRPGKEIAAIDE